MRPPVLLRSALACRPPVPPGARRTLVRAVSHQPARLRALLDALSSRDRTLLIAHLYAEFFPAAWAQEEDQGVDVLDRVARRRLALRLLERLAWAGRLPVCEAWLDDWWTEADDPAWAPPESEDPLLVVPVEMLHAYDWERYPDGEAPVGADFVLATLLFGLENTFSSLLDDQTAVQGGPVLVSLGRRIRQAAEEGTISLDRLRNCGDILVGVPEPYCHLPLLARHMEGTVGCFFLDCTEDDSLRFFAWDEVRALCRQWAEAQGLLAALYDLRHASETDPPGAVHATLTALATLL